MIVYPNSCDVSKIKFNEDNFVAAIDDDETGAPTRVIYRDAQEDVTVYFVGIVAQSEAQPGRFFSLSLMSTEDATVLFNLPENLPTKIAESRSVWFGPFDPEQANKFNRIIFLEYLKRNTTSHQYDYADELANDLRRNPQPLVKNNELKPA
jgi:hypothetical protein